MKDFSIHCGLEQFPTETGPAHINEPDPDVLVDVNLGHFANGQFRSHGSSVVEGVQPSMRARSMPLFVHTLAVLVLSDQGSLFTLLNNEGGSRSMWDHRFRSTWPLLTNSDRRPTVPNTCMHPSTSRFLLDITINIPVAWEHCKNSC